MYIKFLIAKFKYVIIIITIILFDTVKDMEMDLKLFNQFKKWAIIALFSDDELSERFVLKGGTALQFLNISNRASMDIDVSMTDDFSPEELSLIKERMENAFKETFSEYGFIIFDFKFFPRPMHQDEERNRYWGGYSVEFKIHKTEEFNKLSTNLSALRRSAEIVGKNDSRKFSIDISKREFCYNPQVKKLEGYSIYLYTPEMIICEKIRALCQQLPQYFINGGKAKKPRPRDFYDIYTIMRSCNMTFEQINMHIFKEFFKIKMVDLSLLDLVITKDYCEYTKGDVKSLINTLPIEEQTNFNFDKYFSFVANGIKIIKNRL